MLFRSGLNEEKYLEPLFVRVKEKLNPASYMLEKMSEGLSVEDIIKEFAISQ